MPSLVGTPVWTKYNERELDAIDKAIDLLRCAESVPTKIAQRVLRREAKRLVTIAWYCADTACEQEVRANLYNIDKLDALIEQAIKLAKLRSNWNSLLAKFAESYSANIASITDFIEFIVSGKLSKFAMQDIANSLLFDIDTDAS